MKAYNIAFKPGELQQDQLALSPEEFAAMSARYSRSSEGFEVLAQKTKDLGVDGIFKMVDYGHASIGDAVPVAIVLEDISMWIATTIWHRCPVIGGTECSTRYMQMDRISPYADQDVAKEHFKNYETAVKHWSGVPHDVPDSVEPGPKRERLIKNFVYDRARYLLPMSALTSMSLVMPAREWAKLCVYLLSHPYPEAREVGCAIHGELGKAAPRLIKHARADESFINGIKAEHNEPWSSSKRAAKSEPFLRVFEKPDPRLLLEAMDHHTNRYSWSGKELEMIQVSFGWAAVPMADIRDFNRHRTGRKRIGNTIVGQFYAQGQRGFCDLGEKISFPSVKSFYDMSLGAQVEYKHNTDAASFLYQCELRTGQGSHFHYSSLMREVFLLWAKEFPYTAATNYRINQ